MPTPPCHSCERRVYMMERVCAEGLYFHRECFRCSTCSSSLRQGMHAFDSGQGFCSCNYNESCTRSFCSRFDVKTMQH
uniref:LIM zinc-binding domain-containing protein n=1 Tax=Monopterus albus TaxID=43700 RepID=A0A3Q3KJD6_MONAL